MVASHGIASPGLASTHAVNVARANSLPAANAGPDADVIAIVSTLTRSGLVAVANSDVPPSLLRP